MKAKTSVKRFSLELALLLVVAACGADTAEETTAAQATVTTPAATEAPDSTQAPATTSNRDAEPAIESTGTQDASPGSSLRPWIDTHAHPRGISTTCMTTKCINAAIEMMDEYGLEKAILINPPAPEAGRSEQKEAAVRAIAATRPDRFYYGAGGNVLNAIIEGAGDTRPVDSDVSDDFEATLQGLVATGGFVSFGEMCALHLSLEPGHAFEDTPPNSPLFLRLAAVAAAEGVPLDIHIDVVETTMDTPDFFLDASSSNPDELQGNVDEFEELLTSNRNARIVLAHVGRDTTGDMSVDLMDRLLDAHSNLYIQIVPAAGPLFTDNAILDSNRVVREEWLTLLETYRDRVVLGSDVFFSPPDAARRDLRRMQLFLQQLPEDLAYEIGCTNAVEIYRLSDGCE